MGVNSKIVLSMEFFALKFCNVLQGNIVQPGYSEQTQTFRSRFRNPNPRSGKKGRKNKERNEKCYSRSIF